MKSSWGTALAMVVMSWDMAEGTELATPAPPSEARSVGGTGLATGLPTTGVEGDPGPAIQNGVKDWEVGGSPPDDILFC